MKKQLLITQVVHSLLLQNISYQLQVEPKKKHITIIFFQKLTTSTETRHFY